MHRDKTYKWAEDDSSRNKFEKNIKQMFLTRGFVFEKIQFEDLPIMLGIS